MIQQLRKISHCEIIDSNNPPTIIVRMKELRVGLFDPTIRNTTEHVIGLLILYNSWPSKTYVDRSHYLVREEVDNCKSSFPFQEILKATQILSWFKLTINPLPPSSHSNRQVKPKIKCSSKRRLCVSSQSFPSNHP